MPDEPNPREELANRLRSFMKEKGLSHNACARQAGVSPNAVNELLHKRYAVSVGRPTSKQREGWARTLTKVCDVPGFPIRPEEALAMLGVPHDAVTKRAIERVRSRGAPRGELTIGYLAPSETHAGPPADLLTNFTTLLATCVNPQQQLRFERLATYDAAIKTLHKKGDMALVAGLYATANRRAKELTFLQIPGMRVPLAALVSTGDQLGWTDLLGSSKERPYALVLKEDVGHLWSTGPGRYVVKLEEIVDPADQHHTIRYVAQQYLQLAYKNTSNVPTLFIADSFTVGAVLREVRVFLNPSDIDPAWLERFQHQVHRVGDEDTFAPAYPVAIASLASAHCIKSLELALADVCDIYQSHTAQLYARTLADQRCRRYPRPDQVIEEEGNLLLVAPGELSEPGRSRFSRALVKAVDSEFPKIWHPDLHRWAKKQAELTIGPLLSDV